MKVYLHCDAMEPKSNIGVAKALTEILSTDDLREIAEYLLVFANNNSVEHGVVRKEDDS